MAVERDKYGQYIKPFGEFTDQEWKLFHILEEIPTDDEDKTISAYMADVLDLFDEAMV